MTSASVEVLERWDLLEDPTRFHSLTWENIKSLAEEIEAEPSSVAPALNGCHVGLHESILVAEGRADPSTLAFPLLMNETLWLPDPIVSFMSRDARHRWEQTFEAGGTFYGASAGARMPWRSLWSYPKEQRRDAFRGAVPKLLDAIRSFRPLIETGAIRLFPWERIAYANPNETKTALQSLQANDLMASVHVKYRQGEYTLGARVGPMDISAKEDWPEGGLKKGEPLHFVDKGPQILTAITNLSVSRATGATYNPTRRGDRLMSEFIAGGATAVPTIEPLSRMTRVPDLAGALWPDIVEIKKQSEVVDELRQIINSVDTFHGPDAAVREMVASRITEVGERLRADTSLRRATKESMTNMSVDGVMTGGALGLTAVLAHGGTLVGAAIGLGSIPVKSLLSKLVDPARRAKRSRADLLVRVGARLADTGQESDT